MTRLTPRPRAMRETQAAICHLEQAVLGARWTEGIVLVLRRALRTLEIGRGQIHSINSIVNPDKLAPPRPSGRPHVATALGRMNSRGAVTARAALLSSRCR